ncbi:serine/threonine protein kinase [Fictibacillus terranigra]|uniref:non-specific serine/threonine protein kinase n=1 Tax=Fictibacillus terranigra TaxID=3058424 RepID=A0ABT8E8V1_9BACL|nr:serine/threonine-protein kinase [Fictibacillus sp. CENA-BCM004]MDN4074314.1 serine/threonine-protein kinase [Fictibacillus sp. CENA-BCM004]
MMFHWVKDLYRLVIDRPLKPGSTLLGRYRINEVLGMGSYGITYAALDADSRKTVAVKQLRKTKSWTKSGQQSFEREKEILEQLNHPAIPSVHQSWQDECGRFIVMDYVSGQTFEDLIFQEGIRYSEIEALEIFKEVLGIVSSMHQKGVIHRDLRIPNIISAHGKLHIIDFGLACGLSGDHEHPQKRMKVNLMREVSVKSDFYALGHFLLFLLYSGYEPVTKKEKSWDEELSLDPEVRSLIRRLLQIDESFKSAKEIMAVAQKLT